MQINVPASLSLFGARALILKCKKKRMALFFDHIKLYPD